MIGGISFDLDALTRDFTEVQKRQVPFATAFAFNRTTEEAQDASRTGMYAKLTIRQASSRALFEKAFVFNREGRADSKTGKLSAELRLVGQPGFAGTNNVIARLGRILIRQEDGGASQGRQVVRRGNTEQFAGHLIPFEGLRTLNKPMPRSLYPRAIGLSPRQAISGGEEFASSYKGGKKKRGAGFKRGTKYYFATEKGIFVREQIGSESEYDGVWWFKSRITLKPRLGFEDTYRRIVQQRLVPNWIGAIDFALRTAR